MSPAKTTDECPTCRAVGVRAHDVHDFFCIPCGNARAAELKATCARRAEEYEAERCSDCAGKTDSAAAPHSVPESCPLCAYHRGRVARVARQNPQKVS